MPKQNDLSKSEWLVMNRVWVHKKTTAREVTEDLAAETDWSYNTVKTMLVRLVEKGWAAEDKVGGTCFYRPAVPRRKAITAALDDLVDRVLDGAFEPLVSYLGKNRRLSDKDVKALEKLIQHRREDES